MNQTVEKGEQLFAAGRLEEARQCFINAVKQAPDNASALNDLAVVYLTLGDESRAEAYFNRAVEAQEDFLEARLNLGDYYLQRSRWEEAVPHLETALELDPENDYLKQHLARAYDRLGRSKDSQAILDSSRTVNTLKKLIESFWSAINYWEVVEDLDLRDRLEGLLATVLNTIDGHSAPQIPFKLVTGDLETGVIELTDLGEAFYYRKNEAAALERLRNREEQGRGPVLEVGPHQDWKAFRFTLFQEIQSEGGCLGDFTQTRKVLKHDGRFRRYDLEETLKYFRENLGPCDCHVYRSIPV